MKEKRIVAFIIDYLFATIIITMLALFLIFSQYFLTEKEVVNLAIYIVPCIILADSYLVLRDIIFVGQSFGKRLMKIKLCKTNGPKINFLNIVLYDITVLIWPIEAILLITKGFTIGELISNLKLDVS